MCFEMVLRSPSLSRFTAAAVRQLDATHAPADRNRKTTITILTGVKAHSLFDIGTGTDNLLYKEIPPRWTLKFTVENIADK